jgi:GMP synthase (glutamine-hydrolysing)
MLPIYVVNNHGQFNHLIRRMLRDLEIDAVMIENSVPADEVATGCRGIVLGGGPTIMRAGNCAEYLRLGIPVLGICLGLHIIATAFGGKVSTGAAGGYGAIEVEIAAHNDILAGYPDRIQVWASHADEVSLVPPGFQTLAQSRICAAEAIAAPDSRIYGLQWHPEVSHTIDGRRVYENLDRICKGDGNR